MPRLGLSMPANARYYVCACCSPGSSIGMVARRWHLKLEPPGIPYISKTSLPAIVWYCLLQLNAISYTSHKVKSWAAISVPAPLPGPNCRTIFEHTQLIDASYYLSVRYPDVNIIPILTGLLCIATSTTLR